MAVFTNFKQSTIIKDSKTQDFFKIFNNNRTDKKYWDECSKTSSPITASAMENIKRICSERDG